ncbi:MAG: hypothetical protein J5546_10275 [Lachnospiraceae bacterium]|nr:hypothetical protein [Lachnospiraceae bacterium]
MWLRAFEIRELLNIAGDLLWAAILTVLIELPIILLGKITKNVKVIIILNVVTNLMFGLICYFLFNLGMLNPRLGRYEGVLTYSWVALAELFLIPLSEAWVYKMLSKAPKKRVYLVTYLANFASFLISILILWLFS